MYTLLEIITSNNKFFVKFKKNIESDQNLYILCNNSVTIFVTFGKKNVALKFFEKKSKIRHFWIGPIGPFGPKLPFAKEFKILILRLVNK